MNEKRTTTQNLALAALSILAVAALAGLYWAFFVEHRISRSQVELQKMLDQKLPMTKDGVTIKSAKLILNNNQISLDIEASTECLKRQWNIQVNTVGVPYYDSNQGAVYFRPEDLKLQFSKQQTAEVPAPKESTSAPEPVAPSERASQKVGRFIDEWVDSPKILAKKQQIMQGVDQLGKKLDSAKQSASKKYEQLAAAASTRLQELSQTTIKKVAATYLQYIPVGTLPDDTKGNIARMAVEKVEVEEGKLTVQLSAWQFTGRAIGYILTFVVSAIFLIILVVSPASLLL